MMMLARGQFVPRLWRWTFLPCRTNEGAVAPKDPARDTKAFDMEPPLHLPWGHHPAEDYPPWVLQYLHANAAGPGAVPRGPCPSPPAPFNDLNGSVKAAPKPSLTGQVPVD